MEKVLASSLLWIESDGMKHDLGLQKAAKYTLLISQVKAVSRFQVLSLQLITTQVCYNFELAMH